MSLLCVKDQLGSGQSALTRHSTSKVFMCQAWDLQTCCLLQICQYACSLHPACTCRRPSFKDIMAQLKLMTPNSDAGSSDT